LRCERFGLVYPSVGIGINKKAPGK
jgi:hypothetical protein